MLPKGYNLNNYHSVLTKELEEITQVRLVYHSGWKRWVPIKIYPVAYLGDTQTRKECCSMCSHLHNHDCSFCNLHRKLWAPAKVGKIRYCTMFDSKLKSHSLMNSLDCRSATEYSCKRGIMRTLILIRVFGNLCYVLVVLTKQEPFKEIVCSMEGESAKWRITSKSLVGKSVSKRDKHIFKDSGVVDDRDQNKQLEYSDVNIDFTNQFSIQ